MPRMRPFDKKTATTYALVHRPQHDPLIHDADAPSQIFTEISGPSHANKKNRVKTRDDLEHELGPFTAIRKNEGEAAEHGIYYDDSNYDYMQHLKEIGGSHEATWIEAHNEKHNKNVKDKRALGDALKDISLDDDLGKTGKTSLTQSRTSKEKARTSTYQNQQDVPDEIAGLQPDMDPRLREVLEALDDEAYIDDEDDVFEALAGGEEIDLSDFELATFEDENEMEDGWESDDTTKPVHELIVEGSKNTQKHPPYANEPEKMTMSATDADGDWLESFAKAKGGPKDSFSGELEASQSGLQSFAAERSVNISKNSSSSRRKKRKGALSASTGFSMTSSSVARTETLSVLDSRFDKIAEMYMDDESYNDEDFNDTTSSATVSTARTGMSRASKVSVSSAAPQLMPANFDNMMDDFLRGSQNQRSKKAIKRGKGQNGIGLQQLDAIRKELRLANTNSQNILTQNT